MIYLQVYRVEKKIGQSQGYTQFFCMYMLFLIGYLIRAISEVSIFFILTAYKRNPNLGDFLVRAKMN